MKVVKVYKIKKIIFHNCFANTGKVLSDTYYFQGNQHYIQKGFQHDLVLISIFKQAIMQIRRNIIIIAHIINKEENNLKGDIYSSSLLGTIYKIKTDINMFSITIRYTSKPN